MGVSLAQRQELNGTPRCELHSGFFRSLWKRHREQERGRVLFYNKGTSGLRTGEGSKLGLQDLWQNMLAALLYCHLDDLPLACVLLRCLVVPASQPGCQVASQSSWGPVFPNLEQISTQWGFA